MSLKVTFNPLRAIFCILLICAISAVAFSETTAVPDGNKISLWITTNWPLVGLAISEALAFLPAKFAGIAKAVYSIVDGWFKKKSS